MTLGNLDTWATYDDLKSFFKQAGCPFHEVEPIKNTSANFRRLKGVIRNVEEFVHAQVFFEMMGISEYYDMDKYDFDKPKLLHDLNSPVPECLSGRFSLVVEAGTMEHIFDIRSVMENIVRMLRVGGWIVHFSPSSGSVDHGFYSFSPCFFYDFYHANGFEDFRCYIIKRKPGAMNNFKQFPYLQYKYGMRISTYLNTSNRILVFFAARKAHSYDSIQIPIQGRYDTEGQVEAALGPSSIYHHSLRSYYERRLPNLLKPFLYRHRDSFIRIWRFIVRTLRRFRKPFM